MLNNSDEMRSATKFWVMRDFLFGLSTLSMCDRRQCAAILVAKDLSAVYAIGYNGRAAGLPNDTCRGEPKQCGCIHAEANALVKVRNAQPGIMLSTTAPCEHCAGLIVNSRVVLGVAWFHPYTDDLGLQTLRAVGVPDIDLQAHAPTAHYTDLPSSIRSLHAIVQEWRTTGPVAR
jgi:dCMP deaminase